MISKSKRGFRDASKHFVTSPCEARTNHDLCSEPETRGTISHCRGRKMLPQVNRLSWCRGWFPAFLKLDKSCVVVAQCYLRFLQDKEMTFLEGFSVRQIWSVKIATLLVLLFVLSLGVGTCKKGMSFFPVFPTDFFCHAFEIPRSILNSC